MPKRNLNMVVACSIIMLMLFSAYPYVFHILFSLPGDSFMGILFFGLIFLCVLFTKENRGKLPKSIIALAILQSVVWCLYFFGYNDTSYLVRVFFLLLSLLAFLLLEKVGGVLYFVKLYNYSLVVQCALGTIAFVLVYMSLLEPIFVHYYENEYRYLYCYGLTCSNAVLGNLMRVGGFFDEPGALAFWGVFALLLNKLTFDKKIIEITLIITLLFTFSAAFFVVLPIYLICYYHNKLRSMVLLAIVMIPIVFVTYNFLSSDSDFLHLTTERFSGGEIRSTRYDQSDFTETLFRKSPVFGIGATNMEEYTEATDNPYEILAKDGIVGFVFTYLPLIYIVLKYWRRKETLYASGILFLDYMQRPFHINEMHYFMLYLFVLVVILKYKRTRCIESKINVSTVRLNDNNQLTPPDSPHSISGNNTK